MRWAAAMLRAYAEVSKANIIVAEDLIAKGIALREETMAIMNRAKTLSEELARFLDERVENREVAW